MNAFIINPTTRSIVALVASTENYELGDNIAVHTAQDLENMTNGQLTELFNNITGESKGVFKTSKAQSAAKVFAAMEKADLTALVKITPVEEAKVEKAAAEAGTKERKVRDSKLQRMAAAFREKAEDGSPRQYTVPELMAKCGTTDKITHQYISILRNPVDRFRMEIAKNKETGTFMMTKDSTPAA